MSWMMHFQDANKLTKIAAICFVLGKCLMPITAISIFSGIPTLVYLNFILYGSLIFLSIVFSGIDWLRR